MAFSGTARLKRSTGGLDIVQTIYAFAMALGLTQVFVGSKTFIDSAIFGDSDATGVRVVISALMLINVVLLGLRFFWVPRNLRHLAYVAAQAPLVGVKRDQINLSNLSVAFHLVMIFVHGTVYYLICTEFEFVLFLATSSVALSLSMFTGYVVLHVGLLLINAAWIGLVQLQAARLTPKEELFDSPGSFWWRNNLVCSLIALAPFSVAASCQSDIDLCMANANGLSNKIVDALPGSPQQFAELFQGISPIITGLGFSDGEAIVVWVLLFLLLNSLIDLLTTGRGYLFFEDVGWEEVVPMTAKPFKEGES
jgi:hypothetical protein